MRGDSSFTQCWTHQSQKVSPKSQHTTDTAHTTQLFQPCPLACPFLQWSCPCFEQAKFHLTIQNDNDKVTIDPNPVRCEGQYRSFEAVLKWAEKKTLFFRCLLKGLVSPLLRFRGKRSLIISFRCKEREREGRQTASRDYITRQDKTSKLEKPEIQSIMYNVQKKTKTTSTTKRQ